MAATESDEARGPDGGKVGFEDMNLRCGASLQMERDSVDGKEQFGVRYIGAIPGISFLTTLPRQGDTAIWMRQGVPIRFRVLAGTDVYAFSTTVLRARSRPASYAHFVLPDVVFSRTVRRHARVETRLPVAVTRADGTHSMAILHDLSLRGATLELVGILANQGDPVSIDLPLILPEVTKRLELKAVVRNCSDYQDSVEKGRFRYGIEFLDIAEEDSLLLHYFIDHLIAELHART